MVDVIAKGISIVNNNIIFSIQTAYAVPTMFFAFMCHASMLPIYDELRR